MEPVYTPVNAVLLTWFRLMGWRISVTGAEHIPARGAAVLATNHVGYLDFMFVGYGARERGRLVRFLAKKEIFDHRIAGPLMRGMRHIPVDRYGRVKDSFDLSVAALRRGAVIGMFPEATISTSFVPAAGKTGAARIAMSAGVPLVPGVVWGTQRILTKNRKPNWQRGIAISVAFGPAIPYGPDGDAGEVTQRLMASITAMVEQVAAAYPDSPAGPHDRWWLPAHRGGTAPSVEQAKAQAERVSAERRRARRAQRR